MAMSTAVLASTMVPVDGRHDLNRSSTLDLSRVPYSLDATPSNAAAKFGDTVPQTDYETVQYGETRYDYQSNGSLSKMVAISADGVAHGAFMGGQNVGAERRVEAWCVDTDLNLTGPLNVLDQHAGYTNHEVTSEAPPNGLAPNSGVVANHTSSPAVSWFGVDFGGCTLAFNMIQHAGADVIWPHIALDYQDKVHMISADINSDDTFYDASTDGMTWDDDWVMITNNSNTLSYTCAGAKEAPGAAACFMQDAPCGPPYFDTGAPQWHHDVFYYEANDVNNDIHQEISAGNLHNVTNYYCEDSEAPFPFGAMAYADMDAIYDFQETPELHIAWPTPISMMDTMLYEENDTLFYSEFVNVEVHSSVWHYNAGSGEWGHIGGWMTGDGEDDVAPDPGVFRVSEDRAQLGVDPETGYLYAIWNVYSDDDRAAEWGGNEMPNGEIYAACSADNGVTWGPRVNLTNTQSPGCESPDCLSESFGTLANSVVDGYLHISYMHDLHAGSSIRTDDANDGSEETVNPMYYMRVPIADVPPHDGTPWDADGHIGLDSYHRKWWFTAGHPEDIRILDKVHVFNEGLEGRYLTELRMYHDILDEFGGDMTAGWDVMEGSPLGDGAYINDPAGEEDWNGYLPPQAATLTRLWVSHGALPLREQAFKFTFDDGTERVYRYEYRAAEGEPPLVEEIDIDNLEQYESIFFYSTSVDDGIEPAGFNLAQNFPNPFNPSTEIRFDLAAPATGSLKVYNLQGQEVAVLKEGSLSAGAHQVTFDAGGLSSGVYFYTLEADGARETRKMLLAK